MKPFQALQHNNPSITVDTETEHYCLRRVWGDDSFMVRFSKDVDIALLDHFYFPPELSGILHEDMNELEFVFAPLEADFNLPSRNFSFFLEGVKYNCRLDSPSKGFELIAAGFREVDSPTETRYRNLREFRDFYKKNDLPKYVQKYFESKIPTNFFIHSSSLNRATDFRSLAKTVNFYFRYFNRKSPQVLIHESEVEVKDYEVPCFTDLDTFPSDISMTKLDPVLIDMFHIAESTPNVRLKYLFYFQVLEYISYYHIKDDTRKRLTEILKRPDLLSKTTEYTKLITEEFKDYWKGNDDSTKLDLAIQDYCPFSSVQYEIQKHIDYFSKPVAFDGGLVLESLVKESEDFDNAPPQIMIAIKRNIEKIRNTLVHLRESRENRVILPTRKNNNLILPYLYLVRRLAEKAAIGFSTP